LPNSGPCTYDVKISGFTRSCIYDNSRLRVNDKENVAVVLYGCETWSLTLREERRLRAFENRVLRRIFGPKWDAVTREWRKIHNEARVHKSCALGRLFKYIFFSGA
jgi:hypothetical protein